ncbi:universal stress protein [Colwelliaceae bacterium 6471]
MNKILVILDQEQEQELALERGIAVAKKMSTQVHVLIHCYHELSWVTDVFGMLENKEHKARFLQEKEDWWQGFVKPYEGEVTISHEIVWGKYFVEQVFAHCDAHQYDLLVKKGHRSESIIHTPADWLLLRDSKVPVYIVVEQDYNPNQPIVVALDLMASSEEKRRLNEKLLSIASNFAKQTKNELHCCFAIAMPMVFGGIDMDQQNQQIATFARKEAQGFLEKYQIPSENLHIAVGRTSEVINTYVQRIDASLTVIGSMGRKNVAGKVIGNTCEQYLHASKKDLLVVGLGEEE